MKGKEAEENIVRDNNFTLMNSVNKETTVNSFENFHPSSHYERCTIFFSKGKIKLDFSKLHQSCLIYSSLIIHLNTSKIQSKHSCLFRQSILE